MKTLKRAALSLLIVLLVSSRGYAQFAEKDSSTTLSIAAASLIPATVMAGTIILNYEAFWKYTEQVPWHWSPDPPYAMHIDKFAHFYLSALGSDGIGAAYRAAGISHELSAWLGGSLTFATGVLVEMEDARHGYSAEYGFSPGDASADLVGSGLPILQHYYPIFNRLSTKLSVWPSDAYHAHAYNTIADDYESQYYWLAFDLHEVTPLPKWLDLAFGFSAENLPPAASLPLRQGAVPSMLIFVGPDLDLRGIPIEGEFWKVFTTIMRYVRIPLPALQVYPRLKLWAFR